MIFRTSLAAEKEHNYFAQSEVLLDEEVRLVVNVEWHTCVKLRLKWAILPVNGKVLQSPNVLRHWLRYGNM